MRLFDAIRNQISRLINKADEPEGDFRGPFGFGRPAHKTDPTAKYTFGQRKSNILPVDKNMRWR